MWITSQIGAREHYAIPRALHAKGVLDSLITDTWVNPQHILRVAPSKRLAQRFHSELSDANVHAWSVEATLRTALHWKKLKMWERILQQNQWFGRKASKVLEQMRFTPGSEPTVFSYSYTALPVFEVAKRKGWRTVLGQIDCGQKYQKLVAELESRHPDGTHSVSSPPDELWTAWRKELQMADAVVVNSQWAAENLLDENVPQRKIEVIPLAYSPPSEASGFLRQYPRTFTEERPMKVLFLGGISLAKGALEVLQAARELQAEPIQFIFVGREAMRILDDFRRLKTVRWVGAVSREDVHHYFRDADLFLFPTHSDGFGLTQLEAQAWKLPVVASRFCGGVVNDEINGLVLPEVTTQAVTKALLTCVGNPSKLRDLSRNSVEMDDFSIGALAKHFMQLQERLQSRV